MIPNTSSCLENNLGLITTVDPTEKHVADTENQLGNGVSGVSSTSTAIIQQKFSK